jgi:large subunit ribosomal protein L24e
MVENRTCSFCGEAIEPGTGKMFIRKDGTVFNFCSNKCKKNNIGLGRVSRRTRWTTRYVELKATALGKSAVAEDAPAEAPEEEKPKQKKTPAKKPAKKKAPAEKSE